MASIMTTVSDPNAPADLALGIAVPGAFVGGGSTLPFTIDISNAGPSTAFGIVVTDTVPAVLMNVSASGAGWTCGVAGQLVTCTRPSLAAMAAAPPIVIDTLVPTTCPSQSIYDTATVTASTPDPNALNNFDGNGTTIQTLADLGVALTASPNPVTAGAELIYTIDVTNNGPADTSYIQIANKLPLDGSFISATGDGWVCPAPDGISLTCTLSTNVPAGAPAPSITVVWLAPRPGGFSLVDTAQVTGHGVDTNPLNDYATIDTTVADVKDILSFEFLAAYNPGLSTDAIATITGTNIAATVPIGTNVTALVATFTTDGSSVTLSGANQTSSATVNDFTMPVTYTVTAADLTTKDFVVTVTSN
jgi:uncharacterized repeat protein (TIGR01451 family)